jgi:hypothetical protein
MSAITAAASPASAVDSVLRPSNRYPARPAAAVPAMAPMITPAPPRGTAGATRSNGATTSVRWATSSAPPAPTTQALITCVPSGTRLSTIRVAYATTPRTTIRLEPSDSVTRTRPARRSS